MSLRELDAGRILPATAAQATADAIVATQTRTGCIPWNPILHADPWNHLEAAMGLNVMARRPEADAAFEWLARAQRPDGAWHAAYDEGGVADATLDANFCSYIGAAAWHHWLCNGSRAWLESVWPVVERAIDFTLDLQSPDGPIWWARDTAYRPWPGAILTSSACIHLSLRSAIRIAETIGCERPDWELSLASLAAALSRPELFESKETFSMDWYYPVLSGALDRDAAAARIDSRWDEFVVEGLGARCVSDRPWVTTGETCELVIALASIGRLDDAARLFEWVQHLRSPDGNYWTGATFPDGTRWPNEQTTWNAGAVLLAWDVLQGGPTARLFAVPETSGF